MKSAGSCLASLFLVLSSVSLFAASPEVPGAVQSQPIALVGGTIHPISSAPIENGIVLLENGKIVAVGRDVAVPAGTRRISIAGKHVFPGLFDAYTNLGLVEIDAVRATLDYGETGSFNPNVKAQVAVNPDSEAIPVTRTNGVLLALTAPTGGLISGRSCVIQLDGWTWEDMTLAADVGMQVQWPTVEAVSQWWEEEPPVTGGRRGRRPTGSLDELEKFFAASRAYQRARQADPDRHLRDARMEAMLPVLAKKMPLVVSADRADQIQSAIAFCARQQVRMILLGGYDAPECAELLKKYDIPVIVSAVYRTPRRRDDDYDAAYTLPERLRTSGIRFCISGSGRFGASNVRNLPYHAATAAAFGLPRDEALRAITLYPAQILGVADQVGSIEPQKDATLIVTDGDPLETATHVEAAFIQGREVQLDDRHQRLYRKYRTKYERQK